MTLKEDVSSCLGKWKDDILRFYDELNQINNRFNYNKITLNALIDVLIKNKDTIGINRKEYKNKYKYLEEECQNTLKLIESNNLINKQTLKDALKGFIDYLNDEMYVTQVTTDIEVRKKLRSDFIECYSKDSIRHYIDKMSAIASSENPPSSPP